MNTSSVKAYYGEILGSYGDEYKVVCIKCGRRSMYVNIKKEVHICFLCGEHGRAKGGSSIQFIGSSDTPKTENVEPHLPHDFLPVKIHSDWPDGWEYLKNRGVDPSKVEWGRTDDVFACFPVYMNEKLVYWQSRQVKPIYKNKNRNPSKTEMGIGRDEVLFNFDNQGRGKPIIVVEGVFDALRVNGVATFGANYSSTQIDILAWSKPSSVFVCYDYDAFNKGVDFCNDMRKVADSFMCIPIKLHAGMDPADMGPSLIDTIDRFITTLGLKNEALARDVKVLQERCAAFLPDPLTE